MNLTNFALRLSSLITRASYWHLIDKIVTTYYLETDDNKVIVTEGDVIIQLDSID